jgi:hypothetical protein
MGAIAVKGEIVRFETGTIALQARIIRLKTGAIALKTRLFLLKTRILLFKSKAIPFRTRTFLLKPGRFLSQLRMIVDHHPISSQMMSRRIGKAKRARPLL